MTVVFSCFERYWWDKLFPFFFPPLEFLAARLVRNKRVKNFFSPQTTTTNKCLYGERCAGDSTTRSASAGAARSLWIVAAIRAFTRLAEQVVTVASDYCIVSDSVNLVGRERKKRCPSPSSLLMMLILGGCGRGCGWSTGWLEESNGLSMIGERTLQGCWTERMAMAPCPCICWQKKRRDTQQPISNHELNYFEPIQYDNQRERRDKNKSCATHIHTHTPAK